jgi:putative ATPase
LAERLPEPERPVVLQGALAEITELLRWQAAAQGDTLRFNAIVGYNALFDQPDKGAAIALLAPHLNHGGRVSLAERIPRHTQRLYQLVDLTDLGAALVARVQQAEEAIYAEPADPLVNWEAATVEALFADAGYQTTMQTERDESQLQVSPAVIERWFAPSGTERLSYGQRLALLLDEQEIAQVRSHFERQLLRQSVPWTGRLLYLVATLV